MIIAGFLNIFRSKRKAGYNSDFSNFMRNAKSRERKKVFLKAAKLATEDQRKMIEKASAN